MDPVSEYQNYRNGSEPIKRLFAREWVFQLVKGGSLPSSHPISALSFLYSTFGYTANEAYSIIRGVLDDCEAIRQSLNHYDDKEAALKLYLQNQAAQNPTAQPQPDTTNASLYKQVVDTALDLLKKGHDPKEVAELLSPEYLAIDNHPVKLSEQEVNQAMTAAIKLFEEWKRQQK